MGKMQARTLKARNAAWPRRADQEQVFVGSLWSALQTHLQGVDRAKLAIVPEKSRHRAALLSRLSAAKNSALRKGGQASDQWSGHLTLQGVNIDDRAAAPR